MMKKQLFFLLVVVPALLFAGVARAQEDDADEDSEPKVAEQAEGTVNEQVEDFNSEKSDFAITKVIFPDHADKKFPAGALIPILIGFQNIGDSAFHIKEIEGSFRHPLDYTYHFQNFTSYTPDAVVGPKQVLSFNYLIRPYDNFDPRQIGLQINVHYESVEGEFHDAAFNGTVDIVDSEESFDGSSIVGFGVMAAVIAAIVHFFRPSTFGEIAETIGTNTAKVEVGTKEDETGGWDDAHQAMLVGQTKKDTKKPSKKKD